MGRTMGKSFTQSEPAQHTPNHFFQVFGFSVSSLLCLRVGAFRSLELEIFCSIAVTVFPRLPRWPPQQNRRGRADFSNAGLVYRFRGGGCSLRNRSPPSIHTKPLFPGFWIK